MKYQNFIAQLKQYETAHIKTVAFPGCCTMDEIPDVFASLLPEIIQNLENNLLSLCAQNQVLAVIGMQIGPPMLESIAPLELKRIYSKQNPSQHFCLVLQYLLLTPEQLEQDIESWYGSETLMIDFTTGKIMDAEYYLSLMLNKPVQGICYGQLSKDKLDDIWQQLVTPELDLPAKTAAEPQIKYGAKQSNDYFNQAFMVAF